MVPRTVVFRFFCIVSIVCCFHTIAWSQEIIKIAGTSSSIAPMKLVAKAFEKKHPDIKIEFLLNTGTSGAFNALSGNVVDIALLGRGLNEKENSPDFVVIEYVRSPLVAVGGKGVTASNLTFSDIARIYSGDMFSWPDGKRLRLILRDRFETDVIYIRALSPEINSAYDKALSRKGLVVTASGSENSQLLESTPGGFGFINLNTLLMEKINVKMLKLNNIPPMVDGKPNPRYPVHKKYYLTYKKKDLSKLSAFIGFLRSQQARKILEETGNICIKGFAEK